MRLKKRRLISAISAIAVLASFQAFSDNQGESASAGFFDAHAFDEAWTGEYYTESSDLEGQSFENFETKRRHFLESPAIGVEEEVEVDENDRALIPSPSPSNLPSPVPYRGPTPWQVPVAPYLKKPAYFPWIKTPVASPTPTPIHAVQLQAMNYYNRGSIRDASQLENEGKGYLKVFLDRDALLGGRSWGTRSLVALIKTTASDFSERFPGRERIQIADIARKAGGRTNHGSHQNGLDADIVYLRKNRKEQLPYGGYGKNGFAEQFVVRRSSSRTIKDATGKGKIVKSYYVALSANFDTEANFNLMLMLEKAGNVKSFFVDKVIIREFFRYAEANKLEKEPAVRSFLLKLEHESSHADHFHLRLFCQEGDTKCVSANAPTRTRIASTGSKKK